MTFRDGMNYEYTHNLYALRIKGFMREQTNKWDTTKIYSEMITSLFKGQTEH